MTNQGGVFVSQEQIYDEVLGLKEGFGEVKALLEQHIALETQRNEGVEVRLENHGTRLSDQGTQIVALDSRVTRLEKNADTQEKRDARKATWPQIIGVITGIIAAGVTVGGVLWALATIVSRIP
ncbi:hypothetical protein [Streptomyces sp. AC495_CC817]|uniref:hypothetical protein n=1 Tax=Streptomyces sp. AC495_CC817 TaxID=2823900 RepID=UPI001C2537A0|nr:hypothetical protein [Streptomyces sp. AC495_CC817]